MTVDPFLAHMDMSYAYAGGEVQEINIRSISGLVAAKNTPKTCKSTNYSLVLS